MTELQQLIDSQKKSNESFKDRFLTCSNKFYTLIPHAFEAGSTVPLINTEEILKEKIAMLETLREMEIAVGLLKTDDSAASVHPIDQHYAKLNNRLTALDAASAEFKMINTYMQNTHGDTHKAYSLELLDAFEVDREPESEAIKQFKDEKKRMLLWHGSSMFNMMHIYAC